MTPLRLSSLTLTIFYLTGPLLITSELLRPEFSIPILLLFVLWVFPLAFPARSGAAADDAGRLPILGLTATVVALALCFTWVYLSGIGNFALCRWDYIKHNILFSYLLEQRLPIYIQLDGREYILHYSLAYYITPVRFKYVLRYLVPNVSLNAILLMMYSITLFLALSIFARRRAAFLLVLLSILSLTGGLDVLGMLAFGVKPETVVSIPFLDISIPRNLEWWGVPYAPQSLTVNLYWAPHHFFGALIGTALLYALVRSSRSAAVVFVEILILVAASAFWSPYVAVGLAALAVLKLSIDDDGTVVRRLRQEGLAPLLSTRGLIACAFAAALSLAAWVFFMAAESLSPPRLLLNKAYALPWLLTYALNYAPLLLALILASWSRAWKAAPTDTADRRGLRIPSAVAPDARGWPRRKCRDLGRDTRYVQ
jgi:hypothetical protein